MRICLRIGPEGWVSRWPCHPAMLQLPAGFASGRGPRGGIARGGRSRHAGSRDRTCQPFVQATLLEIARLHRARDRHGHCDRAVPAERPSPERSHLFRKASGLAHGLSRGGAYSCCQGARNEPPERPAPASARAGAGTFWILTSCAGFSRTVRRTRPSFRNCSSCDRSSSRRRPRSPPSDARPRISTSFERRWTAWSVMVSRWKTGAKPIACFTR